MNANKVCMIRKLHMFLNQVSTRSEIQNIVPGSPEPTPWSKFQANENFKRNGVMNLNGYYVKTAQSHVKFAQTHLLQCVEKKMDEAMFNHLHK